MSHDASPWINHETSDTAISIVVDINLYSLEVLFRTCYLFTDRCYLFLSPGDSPGRIAVRFKLKAQHEDLANCVGEFMNELINQRVRLDIAKETRPIRELIVAQAFAEADLLDNSECEASYVEDPRRISITR
jgi:His-Xaa-Ser system protein HxsD